MFTSVNDIMPIVWPDKFFNCYRIGVYLNVWLLFRSSCHRISMFLGWDSALSVSYICTANADKIGIPGQCLCGLLVKTGK